MDSNEGTCLDSSRPVSDAPSFSPPREMRAGYLARRRTELAQMLELAALEEWKPVMSIINHVRGTGAMYGFETIGTAAENVMKAVQNGEPKSLDLLEKYARAVNESRV